MTDFNVNVQFCMAHLIRDIKQLTEFPEVRTMVCGERLLLEVKAHLQVIHPRQERTEEEFRPALEAAKEAVLKVALEKCPSESLIE